MIAKEKHIETNLDIVSDAFKNDSKLAWREIDSLKMTTKIFELMQHIIELLREKSDIYGAH